jgi:glycosyltransferase involved in cell wall biosynthesis
MNMKLFVFGQNRKMHNSHMKILVLSNYGDLGSSSRVRFYQYLPYLEQNDIKVTVAPFLENGYVRGIYNGGRRYMKYVLKAYLRRLWCFSKRHQFDLLWVEKEFLPWFPGWIERFAASFLGIPYVVDYDDAVFHRYDRHPIASVRRLLGTKIDNIMRKASVVVAGNDYLRSRALKAGAKRVELLPSCIDIERYKAPFSTPARGFTVGWIGTPLTAEYLNTIYPALSEVCKGSDVRVMLIGAGQFRMDGFPFQVMEWSEEREVSDIKEFDVGIMPLPDEPWTRGKCGYKLIQYMACAKPVVASPVGINKEIVEHGVNGMLAENTADWVNALMQLRRDSGLREELGKSGRSKVEREYCIQATAPRLLSLLRDAAAAGQ